MMFASMDGLSRELLRNICDHCDMFCLAALSFTCRSIYDHIRLRPLELPSLVLRGDTPGFAVLQYEVRSVLNMLTQIRDKSPATKPVDWGERICRAFVCRYASDERVLRARALARRQISETQHPYWRLRYSIDTLADFSCPPLHLNAFFLYYWDDRDGSHWEGWWITPDTIGCTRYYAFCPGRSSQSPDQCPQWTCHGGAPSSFIVRKDAAGHGIIILDTFLDIKQITRRAPCQGLYLPIQSKHRHGNRRVYQRSRPLMPTETFFPHTFI